MGCTASRPHPDDLLPPLPLDPHHGHGIFVPAPTSALLHDFNIVPLSPNTYGISMQPGELLPDAKLLKAFGAQPVCPSNEKDSMEHMLQLLESLDMGNADLNATQTKRANSVSSILEDLKPGLERHFNQALGKPLRVVPSPLSGKENAMPAEPTPQDAVEDVPAKPKRCASPVSAVKPSKSKTSFASRFLKRSSSSLGPNKDGRDAVKANTNDDSVSGTTLESAEGPNGSLLFDEDFMASYETALKELSPENWNQPKEREDQVLTDEQAAVEEPEKTAQAPARLQQVQRPRIDPLEKFVRLCPPGGENAVVLYTTSLRGIRKTFEDCNGVRSLLESFQLCVDERDVAMHQGFRNELKEMMGSHPVPVPRLFIKGRYIGGAEDVLQLHEEEDFAPLLQGLPQDHRGSANPCDGCGGARFVPCLECSGSRKVVDPDNAREVIRCPDCNENGLIQCPICS